MSEKKSQKKSLRTLIRYTKDRIRLNRKAFLVYSILRALVILTAIRCVLEGNFESFALCLLSLVLFLLPAFFEERLKVDVPPFFEVIIYLFIFAAEILGEINRYYTRIPGWDTMLHTLNGFLCAAIGFSLVYVMNRKSKNLNLSPLYLSIVAFCFSMTIGVCWEIIEFTVDQTLYLDMQKDFLVTTIGSVSLDPTHSQIPFRISHIVKTTIETADGSTYTINGGYLDIGIIDTMKDLIVNLIGAVVFSVIGYFYVVHAEKGEKAGRSDKIAGSLLLRPLTDEELAEQHRQITEMEKEESARIPGRRPSKIREQLSEEKDRPRSSSPLSGQSTPETSQKQHSD